MASDSPTLNTVTIYCRQNVGLRDARSLLVGYRARSRPAVLAHGTSLEYVALQRSVTADHVHVQQCTAATLGVHYTYVHKTCGAAHDPALNVSAPLNSALLSSAPHVTCGT